MFKSNPNEWKSVKYGCKSIRDHDKTHDIHYRIYENNNIKDDDEKNEEVLVVCVHGLTRNSHDFHYLAMDLSQQTFHKNKYYRVLSIDIVGRGQSEWTNDKDDYNYSQYLSDVKDIIRKERKLNQKLMYIGTSMGGIIGMLIASSSTDSSEDNALNFTCMILNDIGPFASKEALEYIVKYMSIERKFERIDEIKEYYKQIYNWGPFCNDDYWLDLVNYCHIKKEDGKYYLNYDPAIATALKAAEIKDMNLWQVFEKIKCPTLVLHGLESSVLSHDIALKMDEFSFVKMLHFENTGHVVGLVGENNKKCIDFLNSY